MDGSGWQKQHSVINLSAACFSMQCDQEQFQPKQGGDSAPALAQITGSTGHEWAGQMTGGEHGSQNVGDSTGWTAHSANIRGRAEQWSPRYEWRRICERLGDQNESQVCSPLLHLFQTILTKTSSLTSSESELTFMGTTGFFLCFCGNSQKNELRCVCHMKPLKWLFQRLSSEVTGRLISANRKIAFLLAEPSS